MRRDNVKVNIVYRMDNLKCMRKYPDNYIDLIYCDILYGIGKNFKDYKDLKPDKRIIKAFYVPRIKEMHRILKVTGSIYLQTSWKTSHWIRLIMDRIFGYTNFRNEIIWCYTAISRNKKDFSRKHDVILRYVKSNNFVFNYEEIRIPYSDSSIRRSKRGYTSLSEVKFDGINLNDKGKIPEDWWIDIVKSSRHPLGIHGYSNQKPEVLSERIIKASSNPKDTVADFFCGSGTTLVVAKKLKRRYIGCDISRKAFEITVKRLKEVGLNEKNNSNTK